MLEEAWEAQDKTLKAIDLAALDFPSDASALSEARFHKSVKSGEVLCARSIEPKVAAGGCGGCGLMAGPSLTAMGIESFFVCSLLILRGLGKSETSENRS